MGRYSKQQKTRREQPKRAAKADARERIENTGKMFATLSTDPDAFFPFPELTKLHNEREARRLRHRQKQQEMENANKQIASTAETADHEMACLKLAVVLLSDRVEVLESKLAALDPDLKLGNDYCNPLSTCSENPASSVNTAMSASVCSSVTGDPQLDEAANSPRQPTRLQTATMMVDSNDFSSPSLRIASPEYQSVVEEEGNRVASNQKTSDSMFVHKNDEETSAADVQHATSRPKDVACILAELFGGKSVDDEEWRPDVPQDDHNGSGRVIEERWHADVNVAASGQITVKAEKRVPIEEEVMAGDK